MTHEKLRGMIDSAATVARANCRCPNGPCPRAVQAAASAVVRAVKQPIYLMPAVMAGMGQQQDERPVLARVAEAEPVKAVKASVEPWLWALPVIGFTINLGRTIRGRGR